MKTPQLLLTSMLLISCNNQKYEDGFYDYSKVSYIYRLPLIEPYVLTSDKRSDWFLCTDTDGHLQSFFLNAKIDPEWLTKAAIIDTSFILAYTKNAANSGCHCELWYVIDINNKNDTVFDSEIGYTEYLKSKGKHIDSLYNIETMYSIFEKTGKLPPEWDIAIESVKRKLQGSRIHER